MIPVRRIAIPLVFLMLAGTILPHASNAATAAVTAQKKTPKRMILYAPTAYDRVVILVHKGKEYKYYLFSKATPVRLEIQGPTTLSVHVRLLYDLTMKGAQNFTVTVEEDGMLGRRSEVASSSFTAQKSPVSTIKGKTKAVPSKAESFKLDVPGGIHRYTINLRASAAPSAVIRIQIPKRDVQPAPKEKQP